MRRRSGGARRALWAAAALAACLAGSAMLAGCAAPRPPTIRLGTPCVACGMSVEDRRFACERADARGYRVYDSIECLLRDAPGRSGAMWLADYDRATLHAADSLWVVRGEFPSPMGGGFAAFLERAAAERVAAATRGRVDRLAAFVDSVAGSRS